MEPVYSYIITAGISLVVLILGGAIFKTFVGRSFKATDDAIKANKKEIQELKDEDWIDREEYNTQTRALHTVELSVQSVREDFIRVQKDVETLID
jgi:hypothetical protein